MEKNSFIFGFSRRKANCKISMFSCGKKIKDTFTTAWYFWCPCIRKTDMYVFVAYIKRHGLTYLPVKCMWKSRGVTISVNIFCLYWHALPYLTDKCLWNSRGITKLLSEWGDKTEQKKIINLQLKIRKEYLKPNMENVSLVQLLENCKML